MLSELYEKPKLKNELYKLSLTSNEDTALTERIEIDLQLGEQMLSDYDEEYINKKGEIFEGYEDFCDSKINHGSSKIINNE